MPDIIFDKGTDAATGIYLFKNPLFTMQSTLPSDPDDNEDKDDDNGALATRK